MAKYDPCLLQGRNAVSGRSCPRAGFYPVLVTRIDRAAANIVLLHCLCWPCQYHAVLVPCHPFPVMLSVVQLVPCCLPLSQGYNLNTMNESFALASSATESASLPPENASLVPVNPTVETGKLEGFHAMDYACTQVPSEFDSAYLGARLPRHRSSPHLALQMLFDTVNNANTSPTILPTTVLVIRASRRFAQHGSCVSSEGIHRFDEPRDRRRHHSPRAQDVVATSSRFGSDSQILGYGCSRWEFTFTFASCTHYI